MDKRGLTGGPMIAHQYLSRKDGRVMTEELFQDRIVRFLYSSAREKAPKLFKMLTGGRVSSLLAMLNFDWPFSSNLVGQTSFLGRCGVNLDECVLSPYQFTTPRTIFERQIQYWSCRPMASAHDVVVAPSDSRVLVGSLSSDSQLFIKGKFFDTKELIGLHKKEWISAFDNGDAAIFRLTPEKYHYNHCPVSGVVVDVYQVSGHYHACNPGAVVEIGTPYSQNKRVVTIINTDVPGGTGVGLVAMFEVAALMIGDIVQCYSEKDYEDPIDIEPGLFVRRGQPKSLFRPGSSTTILFFQKDRMIFAPDLLFNQTHEFASSRFNYHFHSPLIETDINVRSALGLALPFERQG